MQTERRIKNDRLFEQHIDHVVGYCYDAIFEHVEKIHPELRGTDWTESEQFHSYFQEAKQKLIQYLQNSIL